LRMRGLNAIIIGSVLAACASGSAPPTSPASTSASNACVRDDECVLIRGDVCNPCGGCPSDPPSVISAKEMRSTQEDPASRARRGDPKDPPPACSPCPSGAISPTAHAACLAGRCVMRCTEFPDSGALVPAISKQCE